MTPSRPHVLRVSVAALVLVFLVAAAAMLRKPVGETAFASMPAEENAYWTWVRSVNRAPAEALATGLNLLHVHPEQHRLYLRLAELCRTLDQVPACMAAFDAATPEEPTAAVHRRAARALVADDGDGWAAVAADPALDPALARRLVDRARAARDDAALAAYASDWRARLAADSTSAGAAFGLGYAAVLRAEWDAGERLLRHAVGVRPGDAEAYRELGRVYYVTGQPGRFEEVLTEGIRVAHAAHDPEQETILRGNLGLSLLHRGSLDEAEKLFKTSLATSRALSDAATEGFNLYRLATVRLKQHRYDEVFTLLDSAAVRYAVHAPRQAPEVTALRGTAFSDLYRFTDAEHTLERAIGEAEAQGNVMVQVQASVTLAQLRMRMGRYAAGREIALEALDLARRFRQADAEFYALVVLGDVENRWGNFEKAYEQYLRAADVAQRASSDAWRHQVGVRLGRTALNLGDVSSAESYFRALGTRADSAVHHYGLAKVYRDYGNLERSLAHYRSAVRAADAAGNTQVKSWALRDQAWALLEARPGTSGTAPALALLAEAERLLAPDDASSRYQLLIARGNVHLNERRFDAARADLESALALEQEARHPYMQALLLHSLALVHWQRGAAEAAERSFDEAVSTLEAIRDNLRSRERRATFVQDAAINTVYHNFAAFLKAQGRAEEAFAYLERARSRSLTDLLHTTVRERALDLAQPVDRRIEAERQKRALSRALAGQPDAWAVSDEPLAVNATRAGHLRREYLRADSIYHAARPHDPAASGPPDALFTMLTAAPLSAADAQKVLLPGEALVTYNLAGDQAKGLLGAALTSFAYVITPERVTVVPLAVDPVNLAETVRFYRDQLGAADGAADDAWTSASQRLHERLIAPLLPALPPDVEHLHVVPQGILHYLPFATLQDASGRFLVERFTLSTTPSAGILKISRESNPKTWRSILLLADPNGRLPGSRTEAARIGAIPLLRTLPLAGERATIANLKSLAFEYDIIHIATHGTFNRRAPLASHLEFHGDEVLRVSEVASLDLNAYLVTLSACETGLSSGLTSDLPNGEEWVGLNQAFLAAGTPTVMTSLWPIDDQVSSDFMVAFYESLQNGMSKSEALAAVQRTFARRGDVGHPFFWGAFTVVGDPL